MNEEHEQFISEEDRELTCQKKVQGLTSYPWRKREMDAGPAHVTDADFNDMISKNPIAIIDFWASWCGPCRALAPTIEELAKELSGKVFVGKLNVDENPSMAERFQVYSIPTVIIMKNGKEVDRVVGCIPKEHIKNALRKHIE